MRKESSCKRNQTGTDCGLASREAVTSQITSSFLSRAASFRSTVFRLEGEALQHVADRLQAVPRWCGRPVCLVVAASRSSGVEEVVGGGQSREIEDRFDQLQRRCVLVDGRLEVSGFRKWRDDPRWDADAEPIGVDLRRRDVVEV